jgi:hypothetical protein
MKQYKLSIVIVLLLVILIVPSVALAAWWNPFTWNWNIFDWFSKPQTSAVQSNTQNQNTNQVQAPATQTQTSQTAGWETYTNSDYGFEFQYPSNYQSEEPDKNLMKPNNGDNIAELYGSPDNIIITYISGSTLDLSNGKTGTQKIYFDKASNQWMIYVAGVSGKDGSSYSSTNKLVPFYTTAGLSYFGADTGVSCEDVVALSYDKFVGIGAGDNGTICNIIDKIVSTFQFTNQAINQTQNTPTVVTPPTTTNVPVNTKPSNFTCLSVKNVTYTGSLTENDQTEAAQGFQITWGNSAINQATWGVYGTLMGIEEVNGTSMIQYVSQSSSWGNNTNLVPLTIAPSEHFDFNGPVVTQDNYTGGVMTITCSDGKTVNAHIPSFTYKQTSTSKSWYVDGNGNIFSVFYVASDGSTYYDSALTKLARSASQ